MNRPKTFSVLRIGAATLCLLASCLTLGLWARSFYRQDDLYVIPTSHRLLVFESGNARLRVGVGRFESSGSWFGFRSSIDSIELLAYDTFGFRLQSVKNGFAFAVPHWFLSSALGLCGIASQWMELSTLYCMIWLLIGGSVLRLSIARKKNGQGLNHLRHLASEWLANRSTSFLSFHIGMSHSCSVELEQLCCLVGSAVLRCEAS